MTDYTIIQLNLSKQNLTELPADLLKYTNLKQLDCSYNNLTVLPELPASLTKLCCSYNKLTVLPFQKPF